MRAVIQRVSRASVEVDHSVVGAIDKGILALVGVTHDDDLAKAHKLADKIFGLRIFEDLDGKMNLSAADLGLEYLVVSQFTLFGDTSRGKRPSFVAAAAPDQAEPLIDAVVLRLQSLGARRVATGKFRADMKVELLNDGPVTLIVDV